MKKIEASGRTTEEALQAAARQLGVDVDALEYETVEEGAKGFLGLGQTPTLVRAWVGKVEAPKARPKPPVEEPVEEVEEPKKEDKEVKMAEVPEQVEEKAKPEQTEEPGGDAKKLGDDLVAFLSEVTAAMQMDAKPQVKSIDSQEVLIELVGKDVAVIIGTHGQTLDALQYIAGIVAGRMSDSRRRIILDADGYRERLREILRQKALEYAKAAVEAGKEAVLEPQPARDRRIVHLALAESTEVYTYSEGEGDQRHVVISPKK